MKRTKRWLRGTQGRVLHLLRRQNRTVNELAAELGVTDNAVRAQLASLGRDGLVEEVGSRPGVRKPEAVFGLSGDARHLFPKAYDLLLNHLVNVISGHLPEEEVRQIFEEVGHRLAASTPVDRNADLNQRLEIALHMFSEMGGLPEVVQEPDFIIIRGRDCPIAAAVQSHPKACLLAEVLLSDLLGCSVTEQCDRSGPTPHCIFKVAATC
jgi:predicted ArsR family transcriptional regulator